MEDIQCRMCRYFLQHYVKTMTGKYMQTDCGHCIYPRVKPRKPDTLACVYYSGAESEEPLQTGEAK